ncbi:sterile alpha motif domain-containing protein 12-like [Zootoca vivipara]|uniref:sterile alpha motif domain-containing protein 12-like n=1 Tax=Zootoca vivipara TaxID=8524 RepID=UPI00293BB505|nr:sterile alpha motif domain-containing protein 12-like [Zootoca vivipara]XP_060129197.1 sterile alpha motif domain-containing protein 12-like [Zootoca vivipara]
METSPRSGLAGVLNGQAAQWGEPTTADTGLEEDLEEVVEVRRPVAQWTVSEVCSWLSRGSLGAQGKPLLEAAHSHAISGKALLRLTNETLERMGVAPWSLRQELLRQVLHLRIQQEMKDLLDITGA